MPLAGGGREQSESNHLLSQRRVGLRYLLRRWHPAPEACYKSAAGTTDWQLEARLMMVAVEERLSIRLPVPPSVNHIYIHTRYGTRLHPSAAAFRDEAIARIREATGGGWWHVGLSYVVTVRVTFANKKQPRDLDNCIKLLVDALANGLGFNDKNIVELHAYHLGYDKERQGCDVTVEAVEVPA